MSKVRTFEKNLLNRAEIVIEKGVDRLEGKERDKVKLKILEIAASKIGGFKTTVLENFDAVNYNMPSIEKAGTELTIELKKIGIHPSLSLASLAQAEIGQDEKRSHGAYYTDFRLAHFLAKKITYSKSNLPFTIVDPACGTGILLVAFAISASKDDQKLRNRLLAESICGTDLSDVAIKGALIALSSLTNDKVVIGEIRNKLRQIDSLVHGLDAWKDIAPSGFDAVIGNPPWEKLKLTKHEWLKASGVNRHYGSGYLFNDVMQERMQIEKEKLITYSNYLQDRYELQGQGEVDLYKLFVELAMKLVNNEGQIALIVPAGLIRSQGTTELRKKILNIASEVEFTLFDNKARFFEIDTRFKFISLFVKKQLGVKSSLINVAFSKQIDSEIRSEEPVSMCSSLLSKLKHDLSVPEVRDTNEWKIFRDFCGKGQRFGDTKGIWQPKIVREVDMTRDKAHFISFAYKAASTHVLPLIEGRMVHQYRFGAKKYISGEGRKSRWEINKLDCLEDVKSQFAFPLDKLSQQVRERVVVPRVGFCDISGQTNERTMLAARIPANVVCGNKVPTIIFDCSISQEVCSYCWLAIVNSFAFDWMLRRVVTTTINYFVLLDMPLPKIDIQSNDFLRLAELAQKLSLQQGLTYWEKAEIRAEIDWRVLSLYGHDAKTMEVILHDFPLLDRSQTALKGERKSTITNDFLMLKTAQNLGGISVKKINELCERLELAKTLNAIPYIVTDLVN